MIRTLALLGCALAMAAAPAGYQAEAKGKKNKLCMATSLDGKQTKWKCKAAEKCCYEVLTNQGKCTPAGQACL